MHHMNKKDKIIIGSDVFVPLITEKELNTRIREMGEQLSKDYAGKTPVFIGVLNGA